MNSDSRKPMTLDEQKKVMLNILSEFAKFCDEHGLMYYLDAGTLIGAVRHKGFIPWDDDIDVNMPHKDYLKFVELTKKRNGYLSEHLMVEYPEDTIYTFLKIADNRTLMIEYPDVNPMKVGVYIDVFEKFGVKNKSKLSQLVCTISSSLQLIHWFTAFSIFAWKRPGNNCIKRFIAYLFKAFANEKVSLRLQNWFVCQYAKRYPLEKCKYVTTLKNGEFNKMAPRACFEGYQLLDFEGLKFKAPIDYDTYLRCLYKGDYMQLPPENKRIIHNTKVYWK